MKSYSGITVKYLKENKKKSIFTIVGIILSLALISGVGFLGLSIRDYLYDSAKTNNGDYEFGLFGQDKRVVSVLKNDVDLEKVGVSSFNGGGTFQLDGIDDKYIYLMSNDEVTFNEIETFDLEDGRLPQVSGEILMDSLTKTKLSVKLNDKITLNEMEYTGKKTGYVKTGNTKEFTIVGFYNETFRSGGSDFNAYSFLDEIKANEIYDIRFTVKENKNKRDIVEGKAHRLGIDKAEIIANEDLLSLMGQSKYVGINTVISAMSIFVLVIIILATIFLIYNAINISVAERITQFGILRSIGATPKQIRNIVIKEALLMCLISIPFGILSGFIGVWITIKSLGSSFSMLLGGGSIIIKFYPSIIIFTTIVGMLTIVIAAFGPAKRAGKVSPISVIKGNPKNENIKYYNGRLIRKIFGVEGWVAYKNIRKNSKKFIITILSLSISLIMFITFSTLNMKRIDEMSYIDKSTSIHAKFEIIGEEFKNNTEEIVKKLKGIDGISEIFIEYRNDMEVVGVDPTLITDEYKQLEGASINNDELVYGEIEGIGDNEIKAIGLKGGLKDNEVIIVNSSPKYDSEGSLDNIDITSLKEDDTFSIPVSCFKESDYEDYDSYLDEIRKERECGEVINFKVKKVIDKNILEYGYNDRFIIMMNNNTYKKIANESTSRSRVSYRYANLDDDKLTKAASEAVQKISEEYDECYLYDIDAENKQQEQMWTAINVLVYGFITMISLIGIVNVINTISLNILLKKKEFGTLGTIGMSKGQLSKMVILEGLLHGIIASIIGGTLSVGLILVAIMIIGSGFSVTSSLYWQPFVIGFVINLIIVLIASLIPLNKLKKMSLVETIRNVE